MAEAPLERIYLKPVFDLGRDGEGRLAGIYSPLYDEAFVRQFVQDQFLDESAKYVTRFQDTVHFSIALRGAFARAGLRRARCERLTVLDIGSGSGNTIFPLMNLCPNSLVIGSDISIEMLVHLKHFLAGQRLPRTKHNNLGRIMANLMHALMRRDRPYADCVLLQLNAEELDFAPGSIDLVVGASILHHLRAPDRTVAACARILKPGGLAIFFEPFREGNGRLRDCLHDVVDHPRGGELDDDVVRFLKAVMNDIDVRSQLTPDSHLLNYLDDKWLFDRRYFQDLAREHGFSECRIDPLNRISRLFAAHTMVLLSIGLGRRYDALPRWAWKVVNTHDRACRGRARRDLLTEGVVILRR